MKEWWSIFIGDKLLMGIDKHPMEMKKELAFHITDIVWPSKKSEIANDAQTHFENIIQKRNVPEIFFDVTGESLITVITQVRNCSISEAKRLIAQGGIKINDTKITDEKFGLKSGDIVKVGKLDFAKVI